MGPPTQRPPTAAPVSQRPSRRAKNLAAEAIRKTPFGKLGKQKKITDPTVSTSKSATNTSLTSVPSVKIPPAAALNNPKNATDTSKKQVTTATYKERSQTQTHMEFKKVRVSPAKIDPDYYNSFSSDVSNSIVETAPQKKNIQELKRNNINEEYKQTTHVQNLKELSTINLDQSSSGTRTRMEHIAINQRKDQNLNTRNPKDVRKTNLDQFLTRNPDVSLNSLSVYDNTFNSEDKNQSIARTSSMNQAVSTNMKNASVRLKQLHLDQFTTATPRANLSTIDSNQNYSDKSSAEPIALQNKPDKRPVEPNVEESHPSALKSVHQNSIDPRILRRNRLSLSRRSIFSNRSSFEEIQSVQDVESTSTTNYSLMASTSSDPLPSNRTLTKSPIHEAKFNKPSSQPTKAAATCVEPQVTSRDPLPTNRTLCKAPINITKLNQPAAPCLEPDVNSREQPPGNRTLSKAPIYMIKLNQQSSKPTKATASYVEPDVTSKELPRGSRTLSKAPIYMTKSIQKPSSKPKEVAAPCVEPDVTSSDPRPGNWTLSKAPIYMTKLKQPSSRPTKTATPCVEPDVSVYDYISNSQEEYDPDASQNRQIIEKLKKESKIKIVKKKPIGDQQKNKSKAPRQTKRVALGRVQKREAATLKALKDNLIVALKNKRNLSVAASSPINLASSESEASHEPPLFDVSPNDIESVPPPKSTTPPPISPMPTASILRTNKNVASNMINRSVRFSLPDSHSTPISGKTTVSMPLAHLAPKCYKRLAFPKPTHQSTPIRPPTTISSDAAMSPWRVEEDVVPRTFHYACSELDLLPTYSSDLPLSTAEPRSIVGSLDKEKSSSNSPNKTVQGQLPDNKTLTSNNESLASNNPFTMEIDPIDNPPLVNVNQNSFTGLDTSLDISNIENIQPVASAKGGEFSKMSSLNIVLAERSMNARRSPLKPLAIRNVLMSPPSISMARPVAMNHSPDKSLDLIENSRVVIFSIT